MRNELLAAESQFDRLVHELNAGFTGEGQSLTSILRGWGLALASIAAILAVWWGIRMFRRRGDASHAPQILLSRALRACGLSFADRALVSRVARSSVRNHPTAMLLESSIYRRNADRWLHTNAPRLIRGWARSRLLLVERTLFQRG